MKLVLINFLYEDYRNKNIIKYNVNSSHLGLLTLQTLFENHGVSTEIVDLNILYKNNTIKLDENYYKTVAEYVYKINPDFIGLTAMANNLINVIFLSEELKQKLPKCKLFLGGPQASFMAKDLIEKFSFIDFICKWESEKVVPFMVDYFNGKIDIESIPNLTFRKDGQAIDNKVRLDLISEDEFTEINYDFLIDTYKLDNERDVFTIEGGRGCPFNCSFCSTSEYWKRVFRIKNCNSIVNEIKRINKQFGVKRFSIVHDLFTCNREELISFCEQISKLRFEWSCSSRADVLDSEVIEIMGRSGCKDIFFGIETGNNNIQKVINKNLKLDLVDDIIRDCIKYGINPTVSFIIGFPFENLESMNDTLKTALRYIKYGSKRCLINMLTPEQGSQLIKEYGSSMFFMDGYYLNSEDSIVISKDRELRLIRDNKNMFNHYYIFKCENIHFYYMKAIKEIFQKVTVDFSNSMYECIKDNNISISDFINLFMKWDYNKLNYKEMYLESLDNNNVLKKFYSYITNTNDSRIKGIFAIELLKAKIDIKK